MIVKLPPKQQVQGLDRLVRVTVFGNDVLTQKTADEQGLYIFFPAECQIADKYLSVNSEFRHSEKNEDRSITGFFEDSGRVKAIKFKGVISTGYIAPVSTLKGIVKDWEKLTVGDEFTDIGDFNLCKKHIVVRQQSTSTKESRYNKKLKRFDKLVPNQFRFHQDTSPLARNLHHFNPEDIIVITDKWHGTSAVFSNVLVRKELTLKEKLAKWVGVDVNLSHYDNLYSSRSVIKNQYINKDATPGYYNEDIWGVVHKELDGKIEQGITLYGEIVGFLPSGKAIQGGYDYACGPTSHRFVVYRMTYTKPNGSVIEFPWQMIKNYCERYSIETVKELYHGKGKGYSWNSNPNLQTEEGWKSLFMSQLELLLEGECKHCANKVPAEGVCVRIDGRDTYMTFKLKSKRFLERESKELDKGEVNIEDEQVIIDNNEIQ